jgi:hypothetical protein
LANSEIKIKENKLVIGRNSPNLVTLNSIKYFFWQKGKYFATQKWLLQAS